MKLPKIFLPEKNFDEKLKDIIQDENPFKIKKIEDILSLTCIPQKICEYDLRTNFEILEKRDWAGHFGEKIPEYIIQAGEMTYQKPSSLVFTRIYVLELKNEAKLNRNINLEKEINVPDAVRVKFLKKDKHLVAITTNHTDKCSLDVFGNWYINKFELEVL